MGGHTSVTVLDIFVVIIGNICIYMFVDSVYICMYRNENVCMSIYIHIYIYMEDHTSITVNSLLS
jgi:hypothetical protein